MAHSGSVDSIKYPNWLECEQENQLIESVRFKYFSR